MSNNKNIPLSKTAIVSGTSILVMTFTAIFSTNVSIGSLIVENNSIITTQNIINSEMLFRLGVFAWLIILQRDLIASLGLYVFVHSSKLLFPDYGNYIKIVERIFLMPLLFEVVFGIWLLIRRRKIQFVQSSA